MATKRNRIAKSDSLNNPNRQALTLDEATSGLVLSDKRKQPKIDGALVPSDEGYIFNNRFQLTPVSLEAVDDYDMNDWAQLGSVLANIESATQWWIGDWANLGLQYDAESLGLQDTFDTDTPDGKYQMIALKTGLKYQTLRVYASVSRNVLIRNQHLSFSHHREALRLEGDKQIRAINMAAEKGWTLSQLKQHIDDVLGKKSPTPLSEVLAKREYKRSFNRIWAFASGRAGQVEAEDIQRLREWLDDIEENYS